LTGYVLREGKSTGILHPLHARALFLKQAERRALVISCDLLALSREFVTRLRSIIQAEFDIPEDAILLACTHTHSGPATIFLWECGEVETEYLQWLETRLVELARAAVAGHRQVKASAGKGYLPDISENRRVEGGPIDPEVNVLCLEKLDGEKLAVLFNFACHPTCLQHPNRLVSGDYPGYAMRLVEEATGGIPMFFNAASGNIRPVQRNSVEALQATGARLAGVVLEVLQQLSPVEPLELSFARQEFAAPFLKIPTQAELERVGFHRDRPLFYAPQRSALMDEKQARVIEGWRASHLAVLRLGNLPESMPLEVQVIRLGNVALVGVPGELFVELGLEIKHRSGLEHVLLSCYTNDDVGYIPARHSYAHGGYEVEESYILHNLPSVLSPQVGERLVEVALGLIRQFA
jgi:hypothetical protein